MNNPRTCNHSEEFDTGLDYPVSWYWCTHEENEGAHCDIEKCPLTKEVSLEDNNENT